VIYKKVDAAVPALTDLRQQARSVWDALQTPLALGFETWLVLNPTAIHAAPFQGNGDKLTTSLGMTMQPEIVVGRTPGARENPPPELDRNVLPGSPRLQFSMGVEITLPVLRERLVYEIERRATSLGLSQIKLDTLTLSASEGEFLLQVSFDAASPTNVAIRAKPAVEKEHKRVVLDSIQLTTAGAAPDKARNKNDARSSPLENLLRSVLSWSYRDHADRVRDTLDKALNRQLGSQVRLTAHIDEL